jgi:hypothetical protein
MTMHRALWLVLVCAPLAACDRGPNPGEARAAASATPGAATAAQAPAGTGTTFGAGVKLAEATPIDTILADPKAYQGKTVRVEGTVTDVCPRRGCWFDLAGSGPGKKIKFKVTDGEMVFPLDSKGKYAVAEGVVSVHELSLEQSREYAEDQAKEYGTPYDPASITKPTSLVRLDGTGAVFRDRK